MKKSPLFKSVCNHPVYSAVCALFNPIVISNPSGQAYASGKINEQREEALFDSLARQHMKEIYKMRKAGDNAGLLELQDTLEAQARELADKEEKFRFTPEQIKAYSTIGGAPHLDGSYTVFGEVTEGMEVVDNIEIAKTNRADRPIENIRILKASIQ